MDCAEKPPSQYIEYGLILSIFIPNFRLLPQGQHYRWLLMMCLAVIYNLVTIVGRAVFWQMQNDYLEWWTALDYGADLLYLLDMYITSRTGGGEEEFSNKPKHTGFTRFNFFLLYLLV